MKMKGIDVSTYNAVTDYKQVSASGVQFAIIKVINKSLLPDKRFETHWAGFESAGIPIQGVYNYSYATTIPKFQSDAKRVIEVLAGRKTMVWLDIEDNCQRGLGQILPNGINAYAEIIQSANLSFGIYTGLSFYNSYMKPYASQLGHPFWIARYPSSKEMDISSIPDASKSPDIGQVKYGWQYSSNGKIPGVIGNVDLNEWYTNVEAEEAIPEHTQNDYIPDGFRREMALALGLPETANPQEVLSSTVTIQSKYNRNHPCVTPLERLLKEHGFYKGQIEADQGKTPIFGNGMAKATALYQSNMVGMRYPDQEWTKGNRSYKMALQIQ